NSGEFSEAENLTLEWVGQIPGKRESRRFEGDYIMTQNDVVGQTAFDDVVAHGGWAMDLHPADGVYSDEPSCTQWHSKGVYGIPYRSYYSRNITNLFLAGRIISASHVAFGSTRVMATCAAGGQAVGMAAALCREKSSLPAELGGEIKELQCRLVRSGQYLPKFSQSDPADLASSAKITASSEYVLSELRANKAWVRLDHGWAMLLPLEKGVKPTFGFETSAEQSGVLRVELRRSSRAGNFTPDELVEALEVPFEEGQARISAGFCNPIERCGYHFVILCEDPAVRVRVSDDRMTGVLALSNAYNKAVAISSRQEPPEGIGIESFEFWLPKRRPEGRNLAMTVEPPVALFAPQNVATGPARPTEGASAWVAARDDKVPELKLTWNAEVRIGRIIIEFDPDWDHPMESVLMTHPEEVVPFLVRDFEIVDDSGSVLHRVTDNHSGRVEWHWQQPLSISNLTIRILATHGCPAAIFRVCCLAR
ncbi:MAG: FAD-dependent oxidoreductase, partial [Akkermansiaceae bacterium]|nr:FAD-dependent oxidoreductase [Akkermansiaceae bacterium]